MTSTQMYRLPPILDSTAIAVTLPTCMYKLAPINTSCVPSSQQAGGDSAAAGAGLAQLERRQEAILTRLAQLRREVEEAQQQQQRSAGTGADSGIAAAVTGPPPTHKGDIVVVACPERPPLSLLLLRRLAPGVALTSHVHSTCETPVSPQLADAFHWQGARGAAHVRVIWKPVSGDPRLLVSPAGQGCALIGEDQVFRYVCRALLPAQYEAAGADTAALVDLQLERAERLANASGKEKQAVIKALDGVLSRQQYLLGSTLSLVDGVVWSALRTAALSSPPAVTAWCGRVAAAAGLGEADEPARAVVSKTNGPAATPTASTNTSAKTSGDNGVSTAAAATTSCGSGHLDQAGLMAHLSRLNIATETVAHPAVFTVEAMMPHLVNVSSREGVTKNLFLRDRKRVLYLLTARHDAQFKLADVAKQLPGAKELRFADESELFARLGVKQGCVTPLAVVNDTERVVKLLVDAKLLDATCEKIWCHPLSNEATVGLSVADFRKFAAETGHEPTLIDV